MTTLDEKVGARMGNLVIVWASLVISQVILLGMLYFEKPNVFAIDLTRPIVDRNFVTYVVFAAISAGSLVAALVLRRKFLNDAVAKQDPQMVQSALVISSALCESVTLIGFIAAMVYELQYFFLFFAVGIVATLAGFPRRSDMRAAMYRSDLH